MEVTDDQRFHGIQQQNHAANLFPSTSVHEIQQQNLDYNAVRHCTSINSTNRFFRGPLSRGPGSRLTISASNPSVMHALRLLKKREKMKRGPKEKDTFQRMMYCLADKFSKLPKFSSSDMMEKRLVQDHQSMGYGYPAQDYNDGVPRKTHISLSFDSDQFKQFISKTLYPALGNRLFDIYKIDKQRRLIRVDDCTPRAIKDSRYQGSLIIIPYNGPSERPPQILYRCGEDYFIQVTSTTSPHDQGSLMQTPPELPRPLSEGSIDGNIQPPVLPASMDVMPHNEQSSSTKSYTNTSSTQSCFSRLPSRSPSQRISLMVKEEPIEIDDHQEQESTQKGPVSSRESLTSGPRSFEGKCKIFEIAKFLRNGLQEKHLVHVRKDHIVNDVIQLYQKTPNFLQNVFSVCFEDHSRSDRDQNHNEVPPHSMFVLFWKDVFQKCFTGNQESVPVIDIMMAEDFYRNLGKVLYHGLILLDYWPVRMSQACACVLIVNSCSERQLVTSLHRTMSDNERMVISEAKKEIRSGISLFSSQLTKHLCQVLRFYGNTHKPTPSNLENILVRASKYFLIQKPFWVLLEMRLGLQALVADFLAHLEEKDIFTFYSQLTPNALALFEKTVYVFSGTDSLNEMEEKRVKMYLENFIMKLNCDTITMLIVKWCHVDCLCIQHLYVRFNQDCISERPYFDPDEATLYLSSVYSSQEELHQFMMSELET